MRFYLLVESSNLDHAEVVEDGRHFKTGTSVTFPYTHRKQRHFNFGSRFGQDIEPHGMYSVHGHHGTPGDSFEGFGRKDKVTTVHGTATFKNPLVLHHKGYGSNGWKSRVSKAFGNKKGKSLSSALRKAGHDGIVTVDGSHTSEIVHI